MGYTTRFEGEITIAPPIPWSLIKDSPFMPDAARGNADRDVMFRIAESQVDTPQGVLFTRSAVALVSTWDDEARGYNIVKHVQEAIDALPGHTFGGRIDAEGEQAGDLWRLKVVGRTATRFEPEIVWPEASN